MGIKLRECPFCGGDAIAVKSEHPRLLRPARNGWHIQCNNCDLLFGYDVDYAGEFTNKREASIEWNNRYIPGGD